MASAVLTSGMNVSDLVGESVRTVKAHRLRSFLTLLGIIIGVATLVLVGSVITGLNAFVREKVFRLAPDVFVVTKFGIIRSREEFLDAVRRRNLSFADYEMLSERVRLSRNVAARAGATTFVKASDRRLPDIRVWGTTAAYGPMVRLDIGAGRYFTEAEDRGALQVAIIGADIRDELFQRLDPIGREVQVGGVPYRVIGLIEKQGRTVGDTLDNKVFVPIQAFRRQFGLRESIMRASRHTSFKAPDPFGLVTAETLQQLWQQISAAAFILSLLIASVSLGVGGIVIMNIMLVSVVERTREIGVRLALGARKKDIRRQFLLEAALLSLGGGVAGVALAAIAAYGVRNGLGFPAELTVPIAFAGLMLSVMVGVAAGYWPARSASNLPVVDALRTE
jgi:putative ABC transport system permease protein